MGRVVDPDVMKAQRSTSAYDTIQAKMKAAADANKKTIVEDSTQATTQ